MGLKKKLKSLVNKLVDKFKAWVDAQNAAADAAAGQWDGPAEDYEVPNTQEIHDALYGDEDYPGAVPWDKCRYSSNWDNGAAKRLMNILSPKFDDKKFGDYLSWIIAKGCDHCHVIFVNGADGEGAGYDCLTNASARELALKRVKLIRGRGLGVVGWIVTDDSDSDRRKIFSNPSKYAEGLKPFFPYLSYIVLGLEMDEKLGDEQIPVAKWKALRDAVKSAGWKGEFGTHHTSGKSTYASLGKIVCDQLDPSCTTSQIKSSVKALRAKGYAVCGFEYSRNPDKGRSQAALDAGAFSVGNWAGGNKPISTAASQGKEAAGTDEGESSAASAHDDAVDYSLLQWSYGGFKGGGAKLASRPRIYNLSVTSKGLSYKWMQGGCTDLGCSSSTDANCLACLFCLIDGKWVGGKFDWISTSRTSRDFANISGSGDNPGGYNGWPKDSISKASKYAFVIISKDGKSRTNVITCAR